jgi:hypothetical protein
MRPLQTGEVGDSGTLDQKCCLVVQRNPVCAWGGHDELQARPPVLTFELHDALASHTFGQAPWLASSPLPESNSNQDGQPYGNASQNGCDQQAEMNRDDPKL